MFETFKKYGDSLLTSSLPSKIRSNLFSRILYLLHIYPFESAHDRALTALFLNFISFLRTEFRSSLYYENTAQSQKKQQKFSFSRANTFLKPLLSEPSYLLQNKGNILLCLCEIFL